MFETKKILAELTEDHPIYKAGLAAYNGVRTVQVRKTIMDITKAVIKELDKSISKPVEK